MLKYLLTISIIINYLSARADEPPYWGEFSTFSNDSMYRADITFRKQDSLLKPGIRDWKIQVYKLKPDTIEMWKTKFNHDGYGGGILTDDGLRYVYVNDWLTIDYKNQIILYSADTIFMYSGKDLGIDTYEYPHTESHQEWLKKYYFDQDSSNLVLNTLDLKQISINFITGKIKSTAFKPGSKEMEQFYRLKKYAYGSLAFIGVWMLWFTFRKQRSSKVGRK